MDQKHKCIHISNLETPFVNVCLSLSLSVSVCVCVCARMCVRVRTYTALTMSSVKNSVSVKQLGCRKLKEQLDALERETTTKLSEMDQYNRDIKVRWPF